MDFRNIIGLICSAAILLVAAALIHLYQLWSFIGNYTVPWFCCALAIALVLLVIVSVLTGTKPSQIELYKVVAVVLGTSIVVGLGMLIDGICYGIAEDWVGSIAE